MTYGTTIDYKNVDTCQKPIIILQCFRQPLDKGAIDGEPKIGPSTICPQSRPGPRRLTQHRKANPPWGGCPWV